MNQRKSKWVLLSATFLVLLFASCTYEQTIKHPRDILVTTGDDIGPYKSIGTIYYADDSWLTFGSLTTNFGASRGRVWGHWWVGESQVQTLQDTIDQHLVNKARSMGGDAIINVSYSYSKIPYLLPIYFGLAVEVVQVSGEVVKRTGK